ncbi:hypothetical protein [Gimesia sp.]|uniref:hypothetical protein n=1 Tax=Gimesia sp. TaxID=2024833 RepID=UPI000C381124|nr:hypothetical protein [Gimesia sp.]MAX37411.1 hypothetical protein [Gimesia sp.]|tara:strand:+ start:1400 stop:2467 length:1068 start_codon:yes stop_codon:yes gene_type:complete
MKKTQSCLIALLPLLCCSIMSLTAFAADENNDLPKVEVSNVHQVFDNGEHNAFTDMIEFKGKYYLTFRTCPGGHMLFPTSRILIMQSDDAKTWQQVDEFSVPKRDVRDPHFLIFKDKLFVYSGTWYCGDSAPKTRTINEHLGFAVWSADGKQWSKPIMLEGTYGHYIWRAAAYKDKAYLCGRRIRHFAKDDQGRELIETAILESDDGLVWKTAGLFNEKQGDETAFLFEENGDLLAIGRSGSNPAWVMRSRPPFETWDRKQLDRYIGGPLLAKWGDHYLVGGRQRKNGKYVTSLYWFKDDELHEFASLPSGGDNSYPGILILSPDHALVSYYSSHEKDEDGKPITAIYMADLKLK